MTQQFYYFPRRANPGLAAIIIVSKTEPLPDGYFRLVEHTWGPVSLWFIERQNFTADERQAAYCGFIESEGKGNTDG